MNPPDNPTTGQPENPPVGKTWTRLYIIVIVWLAVQVVAFYAFTKAFE